MRKVFAGILIVIGILLLLSPTIKDLSVVKKVDETVKVVEEYTPEIIKENETNAAEFDFNIVEDISVTGTLINQNKVNLDLIVGQLVVPSINLNIPVFKGINNTNLLAGSATMREDQIMGQGNYPLAGHYVKDKDVLFGSLMDVKEGDIIRLTDKETIYEYETYEVKQVPDTAVYLIDDKEAENMGKPIISLMTCYYSSKTRKRYFVMGELKDSYAYSQDALYAK